MNQTRHASLPVTGAVLAGGRGSRLEGADKGLLSLNGRPLVAFALAALAPQTREVIISANRNLDRYRAFGHRVVTDGEAGFPGPLAGILSALRASATDYVATVPCDAPRLAPDYVARLWTALQERGACACVARDGGGLQPVHLLLHRDLAPGLAAFLDAGGRAVRDWLATLSPATADFSDHPEQFRNINTAADLAAFAAEPVARP